MHKGKRQRVHYCVRTLSLSLHCFAVPLGLRWVKNSIIRLFDFMGILMIQIAPLFKCYSGKTNIDMWNHAALVMNSGLVLQKPTLGSIPILFLSGLCNHI